MDSGFLVCPGNWTFDTRRNRRYFHLQDDSLENIAQAKQKENLSQHLNPSAGRSCSYDAVVPGKNSKLVYSCDAKGKVNLGAALLWSEVKFSVPPDR